MASKRLKAAERKKQILRCATRVFARSNFRAARVADIAAEAGISDAAIYKYFPSKKSIYLQILRHMSDRILVVWKDEVNREPDALTALRNMGLTYYRRMIRHPDELRVQFQAVSEVADVEIGRQLRHDHRQYVRFIQGVLEKGQRQGGVRSDLDLGAMAFLFNGVGILMNMMNLLSMGRRFGEAQVKSIVDHLIASVRT